MANVQYSAVRRGAPAQAALPVAQGIQPADELAAQGAQAAGGQVAQVDGQEALPAAEHVALEIQPAAAQVPQQAMEQVQQGELGVEYVYFCRLCVFFTIPNRDEGGDPLSAFLFNCFRFFPFVHCSCFSQFVCCF